VYPQHLPGPEFLRRAAMQEPSGYFRVDSHDRTTWEPREPRYALTDREAVRSATQLVQEGGMPCVTWVEVAKPLPKRAWPRSFWHTA
jgi:hypothetical protein